MNEDQSVSSHVLPVSWEVVRLLYLPELFAVVEDLVINCSAKASEWDSIRDCGYKHSGDEPPKYSSGHTVGLRTPSGS
jgi:hypothetical protein